MGTIAVLLWIVKPQYIEDALDFVDMKTGLCQNIGMGPDLGNADEGESQVPKVVACRVDGLLSVHAQLSGAASV
ncbi:MAG: hypothetical protein WC343_13755 [Bacilli bacterium]